MRPPEVGLRIKSGGSSGPQDLHERVPILNRRGRSTAITPRLVRHTHRLDTVGTSEWGVLTFVPRSNSQSLPFRDGLSKLQSTNHLTAKDEQRNIGWTGTARKC